MGVVVGEKITRGIEMALARRHPVIIVSCSGGARMMEGALSLMQMAKVCAALARLDRAALPFISVLTDPTMAGTTVCRHRTLPVRRSMPSVASRLFARSNSVRKMRPSQTMGDESPGPTAVFQTTFWSGPNVTGGLPSPSPEEFGPLN